MCKNLSVKQLFSYRKYWAKRFGLAPFLPMSRSEMDDLGWDSCDVILVTGDAYVDHPSFGMALVGRLLEQQGFRVGIISQPDWTDKSAFMQLGKPNLFFGVTAGNMDSMVNRYTSERKIRRNDAYTPNDEGGKRPDRAVIVYTQSCREAYQNVPVIIGGIEASLRRIAHYDYWSDKVRRSVLLDSKADMLIYGNAERALTEVAHQLANKTPISELIAIRGTVVVNSGENKLTENSEDVPVVRLASFEKVQNNKLRYAQNSRDFHQETNPGNAKTLLQRHGTQEIRVNPPPIPLTTEELDQVYAAPFARVPHPSYKKAKIPAYEMIRFSISIMRGCFAGCTFCSITEHEGRIIQSRSEESILKEINEIKENVPGFTGVISDLGGPTANMYRMKCKDKEVERVCRRLSCIYPTVCSYMETSHKPLTELYKHSRKIKGVKKIFVASGVRYDLAVRDPEYIKELATHHVGGYLKIAPEHTEAGPLKLMMKPEMDLYDRFQKLFQKYSKEAGKEQYLIPYFIAAHPGTSDQDMIDLAFWLKKNNFRLDQVQAFLPTPMSIATAIYHSEYNPMRRLKNIAGKSNKQQVVVEKEIVPKGGRVRRLHKALIRFHDPKNWNFLRAELRKRGFANVIGRGNEKLVPTENLARKRGVKKR